MLRAHATALFEFILKRRNAYNLVFDEKNQSTRVVLEDLAKFCRAYESSFHPDPRVHAMLEGRREVWLRIAQNLKLDAQDIYDLHVVKNKQEMTP